MTGACPEPQRPLLADSTRALELFTWEKPSLPGWPTPPNLASPRNVSETCWLLRGVG